MGDGYFALSIYQDRLEFYPYEGYYRVDMAALPLSSGLISIVDYEVEVSAEGETWTEIINHQLTYDPAQAATGSFDLTLEGEWPEVFKCKKSEEPAAEELESLPMS
ncbi:MAG: hypothetical protein AAF202_01425 [Pseudomonadota bacterium]